MLILLGYLVVLGTVFGGYLMTGGSLGALYQPAELVIIAGAGIGSFIVGNNGKAIKGTLKALPLLFRRSKYTKAMYMDLLALLYRLMAKSKIPVRARSSPATHASLRIASCLNLSSIICA